MTVNNVNALSPFGTVQGSQASVKPEEVAQERFDKLMNKMSDQLAGMHKAQAGSVAAATAPKQPIVENAQETVQPKDTAKLESADQASGAKQPEDVSADDAKDAVGQGGGGRTTEAEDAETQETVEKAAEELVSEIADVMDAPLEKVEEAMEVLGLTAVDLFDPANLKQLLLNLTDSADELALVTDETLYGNLQELFQTVDATLGALQEELGLSAEELDALLAQIGAEKAAVEEPALTMPGTSMNEEPEVGVEGMKDYAVSVQKDGGTVQIKVTVDDASGEKHVSEQVTDAGKPETSPVSKKENMADTGHKGEENAAGNNAGNAFLQNLTGRMNEVEAPVERPVYTQPETNQIMDQIVEYMKFNLKPDMQEMEMQLHPASLGTVHVQIAAKDGMITAQFAAQNETVKAVLETQMIQLKEQFEEQGIKVEAVEVTVANHSYGEQFGAGQDAADQQNEGAKKGARRINLNLDELEEEGLEGLDDSERIAVEMMQASGSTVDYTA
ncbi:MAG: flagellar hook-length control protein FliK [Lachnospiraceae bacterium]|nr:flagellar hook-length control protein FliK [Lachnospiraceae bacterium]